MLYTPQIGQLLGKRAPLDGSRFFVGKLANRTYLMKPNHGAIEKIREWTEAVCRDCQVELFDVEFVGSGKHRVVRIYIDKPEGVRVDECARVSRELSTLMDVEDPLSGAYRLEVSSPGLDRPIRLGGEAEQMIGKMVKIKTKRDIDDRRKFTGRLVAVKSDLWFVSVDGHEYEIPEGLVEKANMIYEF